MYPVNNQSIVDIILILKISNKIKYVTVLLKPNMSIDKSISSCNREIKKL